VASHSSWLYAHNILHFVHHVFPEGNRNIDRNDEIVSSSLVTVGGEIVHKGVLKAMSGRPVE
jgi:NAD(P) transhydrogenase subunit alpha